MAAKRKNLDQFLNIAYKKCITVKSDHSERAKTVFKEVFKKVKSIMEDQCNYFKKYSSHIMVAGSVYDGIKITKMDEYDMDIVIRLPISYQDSEEGIIIENDRPGYVKLKIGKAFDDLLGQNEWEKCHKVTRSWKDNDNYFLQNKFRDWLHSIVARTIKKMKGQVTVNGVIYSLKYSTSGPAFTLHLENLNGEDTFNLDVDLVPVIKFQLPRWPNGYRRVNDSPGLAQDWLVVPKPNMDIEDETLRNRCWRLSFHVFEGEMLSGCQNLKMTIRLIKKLRDSLKMENISSYYIKTLFLWRIDQVKDKHYWNDKISKLFREMVGELHNAIAKKNIPYFWNEGLNLISAVDGETLEEYEKSLTQFIGRIDNCHTVSVVSRLLTIEEMKSLYRLNNVTCQSQTSDSDISNIEQEAAENNLGKLMDCKDTYGNIRNLPSKLSKLRLSNNSFTNALENKGVNEIPSMIQDTKLDIKTEKPLPCSKDFDGDERPKRFKYNSYE